MEFDLKSGRRLQETNKGVHWDAMPVLAAMTWQEQHFVAFVADTGLNPYKGLDESQQCDVLGRLLDCEVDAWMTQIKEKERTSKFYVAFVEYYRCQPKSAHRSLDAAYNVLETLSLEFRTKEINVSDLVSDKGFDRAMGFVKEQGNLIGSLQEALNLVGGEAAMELFRAFDEVMGKEVNILEKTRKKNQK